MRHLNDVGGGIQEGPDGRLYEWVEGLSAWGEPVGYWQGLRDVPVEPRASIAGLGALYEAPDGSVYRLQGVGEDEAGEGSGAESAEAAPAEPPAAPKMGAGRPGEVRTGPDGHRYRWVLGVGPAGRRVGFWRRMRPHPRPQHPGPRPHPAPGRARAGHGRPPAPGQRHRRPLLKRLLPLAKVAASLIPVPGAGQAVRAGLTLADKAFTRKGVSEYEGIGALYEASDGSLYAVHGVDEGELQGVYDSGVEGVESAEIEGFAAGGDIEGVDGDGIEGETIEGIDGVDAYVPEKPAETPMFDAAREPPDHWKPLW